MPVLQTGSTFEEKILEESLQSPAIAMMRLTLEIDRQLRLILAAIGRLGSYSGQSPSEALDLIGKSIEGASVPPALRDTLKTFWDLRNNIVHGYNENQGFALRAVDYGLRILRMVQSIPRPSYRVVTLVELFSDKFCTRPRLDVRGIVLDHFGLKGELQVRSVHATRRNYERGQSVSWEWNTTGEGWGETWYRDPDTHEVKCAWSEASEFVGRPLDTI